MTAADHARRYRATKGATPGRHGPPPTTPCGTTSAYRRHLRHKETPCDACKAANARAQADYQARRNDQLPEVVRLIQADRKLSPAP